MGLVLLLPCLLAYSPSFPPLHTKAVVAQREVSDLSLIIIYVNKFTPEKRHSYAALPHDPRSAAEIKAAIDAWSPERKRAAAQAILGRTDTGVHGLKLAAELGGHDYKKLLVDRLNTKGWRGIAIRAIAESNDPDLIPPLLRSTTERGWEMDDAIRPNDRRQVQAILNEFRTHPSYGSAYALGALGSSASRQIADAAAGPYRRAVLEGLAYGEPPGAIELLTRVADLRTDVGLVSIAFRAGGKAQVSTLVQWLRSGDTGKMHVATGALPHIPSKEGITSLLEFVKERGVMQIDESAVIKSSPQAVREFVTRTIDSGSVQAKRNALCLLHRQLPLQRSAPSGEDPLLSVLLKASRDPSPEVRGSAAHNFEKFAAPGQPGDKRVLRRLYELLEDKDECPRKTAVTCIAVYMNPKVVAKLRQIKANTAEIAEVRRQAGIALWHLREWKTDPSPRARNVDFS